MPGRIEVGSAEFNLLMQNEQFKRAFEESERESKTKSDSIARNIEQANKKISTNADALVQHQAATAKKTAAEWAKAAQAMGVTFDQASQRFRRNGMFISEATVNAEIARAKKIADAIEKEQQRVAARAERQKKATDFIGNASGIALGAGVGVLAAQGIQQGVGAITTSVTESRQAERQIRATFGGGAEEMNRFAEQTAQALGKTTREMQRAASETGTLARNYGLTNDQLKQLIGRSADLAAVTGLDVRDATQRATAAIRGEAEAAEVLGLTLNSDAVKAMANMTDEQRKNFETLDQHTKAQIIFNEFMKQSAFATGEAAARAEEAEGEWGKFTRTLDETAKTVGNAVLPEFTRLLKHMNDIIKIAPEAAKAIQESFDKVGSGPNDGSGSGIPIAPNGVPLPRTQEEFNASVAGGGSALAPFGAAVGGVVGGPGGALLGAGIATAAGALFEATRINAALADQSKRYMDAEKRAISDSRRNIRDLLTQDAQKRVGIERDVQKQVDSIIETEQADLKSRLKSVDDLQKERVGQIEKVRDAEIRAAEETRDAGIKAAEQQRDGRLRAAEAARDGALAALEAEKQQLQAARLQEDRGISDARQREDRIREESNDRQIRQLEKMKDVAVGHVEEQIDAIGKKRDAALSALDDERDAEDRRHNEAIRNLEREQDARLGVINEELDGLRRQEQAERRADTDKRLRQGLSTAKQGLKEAQKSGDKGAIRRAQQDVREAEDAISREARDRQREDRRAELQDQAEAIRKEIQQRKDAENEKTQAAKDGFDARAEQIRTSADKEIELAQKVKDLVIAGYQQQIDQAKAWQDYQATLLKDRREIEDREREDRRNAEDADLAARVEAVRNAYQLETQAANDEYKNQTEIIKDQYEQRVTAAKDSATQQIAEVNRQFEAQKTSIQGQINSWDILKKEGLKDILEMGQAMVEAIAGPRVAAAFRELKQQLADAAQYSRDLVAAAQAAMNVRVGAPSVIDRSGYTTNTSGQAGRTQTATQSGPISFEQALYGSRPSPGAQFNEPRWSGSYTDVARYFDGKGYNINSDQTKADIQRMYDGLINGDFGPPADFQQFQQFASFAAGGVIRRPTWLVDQESGHVYGQMAEAGSERILSHADTMGYGGGGAAGGAPIYITGPLTRIEHVAISNEVDQEAFFEELARREQQVLQSVLGSGSRFPYGVSGRA